MRRRWKTIQNGTDLRLDSGSATSNGSICSLATSMNEHSDSDSESDDDSDCEGNDDDFRQAWNEAPTRPFDSRSNSAGHIPRMIEQESGQPAVGTQIRCKPPGTDGWHWATVLGHTVASDGIMRPLSFREGVDINGNYFWSDWNPDEWSRWEPTQLSRMPDWGCLLPDGVRAICRFAPMSGASAMSSCNKQWNCTLSRYTELWRTILMACSGTFSYDSRTLSSSTQHAFDKLGAAEWRRQGALHMSAAERCAVGQLAGADPHLMAVYSSEPTVGSGGFELPPVSRQRRPDADYVRYTLEVWEHPPPKPVWFSTIGGETWRKRDGSPLSSTGWAHHSWSDTLEEALLGRPTLLLTQSMSSCRYRGTKVRDPATVNVLRLQYGTVTCGAADDVRADNHRDKTDCADQGLKLCLDRASTRSLHFVIFARSPLEQFEETPVWELTISDDDLLKAGCVAADNPAAALSDRCCESCCCFHERFCCMFGKDIGNREYKWFPRHSKPSPVLGRRCETTAFGNPVLSATSWGRVEELDAPVKLTVRRLDDQTVLDGVSCMIDDDVWEQLQLQPKLDAQWPVHFYVQVSQSLDDSTYPIEVCSLLRGCVGKVLSQNSDTGTYNVQFASLSEGSADKEEFELVFMLPFLYLDVMEDQERADYRAKDLNSNLKAIADSIKHWCNHLEQLGKNCMEEGDYEQANDVYDKLDRFEKIVVGQACKKVT